MEVWWAFMNKNEYDGKFETFIQDRGVMISGNNFTALNYGKRYGRLMYEDNRRIIISGARSYVTVVPEAIFPKGTIFRELGPLTALSEASHVPDLLALRTRMGLEDFVAMLRNNGMRFN